MKTTKTLQDLLKRDEVLITAGAYDALSARIIEQAGFPVVCTTGFGISASHLGKPDVELYTLTENLNVVRNIVQTVHVPVVADLDTGYGNALNVIRTVREFEQAGCAGGHIEDQVVPKRCPACVPTVDLISLQEAVGKIRAAVDARKDPDFLIIGRTDARGQEAVDRANAYLEAGAGLILFISKAFPTFQDLKNFSRQVKGPLALGFFETVNYPSWFKDEWTLDQLKDLGVKMLNFPLVPVFAAAYAVRGVAQHIARHKTIQGLRSPERMEHEKFVELIGFPEMTELQNKYMPFD
jgi:2-methylisocitrate lyase-like PEP mutase family enzyme